VKLGRAGVPALGVRITTSEQGEVLARSNVVARGLMGAARGDCRRHRDGWFHTGDGGSVDEEGYVRSATAKKDVIISGGENVSSIEVEDVVFSHPAVAEVCVIAFPDEKWGETVRPWSLARARRIRQPKPASSSTADRRCALQVPDVHRVPRCPRPYRHRKLQKFKLRAPYWEGRDRQVN